MKTHFSFLRVSISAFLLLTMSSCLDDSNRYSQSYVKDVYDKTFPVKDIDPNQNWRSTRTVNVAVDVNEDDGVDYKVKIYDRSPFAEDAILLGAGYASKGKPYNDVIDCPTILDSLYVSRIDPQKRRVVRMVLITNNQLQTTFGAPTTRATRTNITTRAQVPSMSAPYTDSEVNNLMAKAQVIDKNGWDLAAWSNWGGNYSKYTIFNKPHNERVFLINSDFSSWSFDCTGETAGAPQIKLIIGPRGRLRTSLSISQNLEIIVANGGEINIDSRLDLRNNCVIRIMPGAKVTGRGMLYIQGNSGNMHNYNGGTVSLSYFQLNTYSSMMFNYGTFNVSTSMVLDNGGTFVNANQSEVGEISNNNANVYNNHEMSIGTFNGHFYNYSHTDIDYCRGNTFIENYCHMKIGSYDGRNIVMGDNTSMEIEQFTPEWSSIVYMGAYSLIDIGYVEFKGVAFGGANSGAPSLVRIGDRRLFSYPTPSSWNVYFEFENILQTIDLGRYLSCSPVGEAPVLIPAGDCTGEGNTPIGSGGDTDEEESDAYTYCYEDYFPSPGDYDFNDIVMDVIPTLVKNRNNQIQQLKLDIDLVAVGANKLLGAGLQLLGVNKNNISSVSYSENGSFAASLDRTMFVKGRPASVADYESGYNNAIVIPVFEDAHYAISGQKNNNMYNTAKGHEAGDVSAKRQTITINFHTPVESITQQNLDLFITYSTNGYYLEGQKGKNRVEIHLRDFWDYKTSYGMIYGQNEEAAGRRTWAICVPNFKYPYEKVSITQAYPRFTYWAQDASQDQDWYENPGTDESGGSLIYPRK